MTNFDTITDWPAYVRACLDPTGHGDMDMNLIVVAGLSKLGGQIAKTRHGAAFEDAVLRLLEEGRPEEAEHLLITIKRAPNVGPRVAAVARRWRGTALEPLIPTLLLRGIEAVPHDPELLSALEEYARDSDSNAIRALGLVFQYNIDWTADHLGMLPEAIDHDGKALRKLVVHTRNDDLPRFLAAIAAIGYADRLIRALKAPDALAHQVERLRPFLEAHPAFMGKV